MSRCSNKEGSGTLEELGKRGDPQGRKATRRPPRRVKEQRPPISRAFWKERRGGGEPKKIGGGESSRGTRKKGVFA